MPAEVRPLTIEQGATFPYSFQWREGTTETPGNPIPLTGATVRMQIRRKQGEAVLLEATSPSDAITLDEPNGIVHVLLPPSKTNLLIHRSCLYDIEADFGNDEIHRLVEGPVTVKPNITQDPGDPVVER